MTASMDAYDLFGACAAIRSFTEVLTNWYIRRSRQRFWDGDADAIDTLHTVLDTVVRVGAPLLPYVAEEIHDGLHAASRCRRSPSRCPTPPGWRRSPTSSPTRSTCARCSSPTTCRRSPARSCRS